MENKNNKKEKSFVDFDSHRVNENTLALLTLHPRFSDKIQEIRNHPSGIPKNGFSDMNEVSGFYQKLMEDSDAFFKSSDFQKKWNQIHEQYDKDEISPREFQEEKQKLNDSNPLNHWTKSIENFCTFFGLHEGFQDTITNFILYNKFDPAPSNWVIKRSADHPEQSKIVINGPVLDKEMKIIFRTAIKMTARYAEKYWRTNNPYQQIERDIKILKLSLEKRRKIKHDDYWNKDIIFRNDRDLASFIFQTTPPDEDSYDFDRKNAGLIAQARKRLKARILKRFPKETFTS